ncbi:MAG: hypothetical protein J6J52_03330 [Oscillospiraceae bacterium]|nr:hypothetical protein [Oscillospiraceae bacterium]
MKRKLALVFSFAMALCMTACKPEATATAPEETTTATEIVTEETTTEATTVETTTVSETEVTTEFTFETIPEDQIPSFWVETDNGDLEIKHADFDNEYVKKLREAYGGTQYPGMNIGKFVHNGELYWYSCYTGENTRGEVFYLYPVVESESADWDYINSRIDIFRKNVESEKVSAVDLDGDGVISNGELETCAIYCDEEYTLIGFSASVD